MIRPFIIVMLVAFAGWAAMVNVWAHAWYPRDCCSGTDCAPLASGRVQVTQQGYVVDGQHHVVYAKVLFSPDEQYHGCFPKPLQGKLGCFWAPRGGS